MPVLIFLFLQGWLYRDRLAICRCAGLASSCWLDAEFLTSSRRRSLVCTKYLPDTGFRYETATTCGVSYGPGFGGQPVLLRPSVGSLNASGSVVLASPTSGWGVGTVLVGSVGSARASGRSGRLDWTPSVGGAPLVVAAGLPCCLEASSVTFVTPGLALQVPLSMQDEWSTFEIPLTCTIPNSEYSSRISTLSTATSRPGRPLIDSSCLPC